MGWETHGYVSESDVFESCANGEYIFAKKDGKDYFIKRFPKYVFPKDSLVAKGDKGILERQARCQEYFERCKSINSRVNALAAEDGDLVICVDMFREKNKIYKVYRCVSHLDIEQEAFPGRYDAKTVDRLMCGILTSVGTMHTAGVVHGDIKYDNIFLTGDPSHPKCVVTDFDDSYLADSIPNAEDIVGTPEYYSPELGDYIQKDRKKGSPEAARIGIASDIFALGILYYVYLTGEYPQHSEKQCYSTLLKNQPLVLDPRIGERRFNLISWMLEKDPKKRPALCSIILQAIKNENFELPDYWSKTEKMEKAAFLIVDEEKGTPVPEVQIRLLPVGSKGGKRVGKTNEKGLWGTKLSAGSYTIRLESVTGEYESRTAVLSKSEFSADGLAKKKISIRKKDSSRTYCLKITVRDKYSSKIKTGVYQIAAADKTITAQGRFTDGIILVPALPNGTYCLGVKADAAQYKPVKVKFNTAFWENTQANLVLTLETSTGESPVIHLENPISSVSAYQNLQNGTYELTYINGAKVQVKERIARKILDL